MKNIFGEPLKSCCNDPITGYFRDGYCRTDKYDFGKHIVCAIMTKEFLKFSKERGNDLFQDHKNNISFLDLKKVINGVYVFLDGKKL